MTLQTIQQEEQGRGTTVAARMPDPAVKVLTLHRDFRMPGGVEKYFFKIKEKYVDKVDYYFIGRRPGEQGALTQMLRLVRDYGGFVLKVLRERYTIVQINPSIERKSFLRDGVFHVLARLLRRKTIVFVHGWHTYFQPTVEKHLWLFRLLYGGADAYVVLSNEYKEFLRAWGVTGPIHNEVTIADEDELVGFDINQAIDEKVADPETRVLFAARVTAHKGIYELIDAMVMLQERYPKLRLIIAGDSAELDAVKAYVAGKNLKDTVFTGWVEGKEKEHVYKSSHLFAMPTYYEGFPQAVVEAMAVGLPVVTRFVGGLRDFFKNEVHGFITDSKDPVVFADYIERLMTDKELYRRVSLNNYLYAQENFLASRAAERMERVYRSVVHGGRETAGK